MDLAASSSNDRLSEQMRGWHLVDPDGHNYNMGTSKFYETDGKYRDLILIFKGEKPVAGGTPYAPEQLTLALDWGGETCPLDGVPQDEPAPGPEPTPAPTEPPEDVQRLNALRAEYVSHAGSYRVVDPVLRGKLLVAVYRDWDDQDPVLSCDDDRYVRDRIPAERLAASLDEADALVLIWPEYESVGIYNTGAVATLCRTRIGAVDLTEDATYYPQTVAENDPPQTVHDREAHSGAYEPLTAVELAAEWLE